MIPTPTDKPSAAAAINARLPISANATLAIQHLLAAYASLVVTPIIVAGALGWSNAQLTLLLSACLVTSGICTLLQCIGFGRGWIGIRLPVIQGTTIAAVPALILIASTEGLPAVFGATMVAGVFTFAVAKRWSLLLKYFPPVVTGTVIAAIGISLLPVAIMWMSGGAGFGPQSVSTLDMVLGFGSLATVLLIMRFARGIVARSAILITLVGGTALAVAIGATEVSAIAEANWFAMVQPFAYGLPSFHWAAIMALILVMIVTMVESTGDYLAIGEVCEKSLTPADIAAGLRAEGLGTLLGGVMNAFPFTTFSQNTGVLRLSGVRSRWVVATAGAMMILLGFVPKLAALAATVPTAVLGGCGIVMFGSIAGTGFNILRRVDLDDNGNLMVVCVSLGMALLVIANPTFFDSFHDSVKVLLANSITLAGISALLLNYLFNIAGQQTSEPA